jgi:glutamine synthetase
MSDEHGAGSRGVSKPAPKQLEDLRLMVRDGRIDTVIVALTDMQGRLVGKRVQAEAFLKGVVDHGIHFCTYLLGTDMEMNTPAGFKLMNWDTGYGDWVGREVWETTRVLPWLESTAIVLCDAIDDDTGEEIPISPRTMLKKQVARATEMGFTVKAGTEFEFYVLADSYEDLSEKGYNDVERVGYYNEDYHILQATKLEPLYRQIRNQMTAARIPIEFSKGEAAPSQHEVNIRYDEVLESADRSVLFKNGAKEIAWLNGYGLTFMAKPYADWTGSSGHLHISLWDRSGEKPLFHEEAAGPAGMSQTMRWFLGGMMALQRELALFIAPNVNSYKRYAVASWAPVNVVWGRDNRTTGFRIVGRDAGLHIENRFPGGDMNAYLAYAAEVAAGLYGIENKIEPPAEYKGNGYVATHCDRMPRALYESISLLEKSKIAARLFGQDVVDHYLNAARVERDASDSVVHAWERERYLERG